jgi:hypothetical protein
MRARPSAVGGVADHALLSSDWGSAGPFSADACLETTRSKRDVRDEARTVLSPRERLVGFTTESSLGGVNTPSPLAPDTVEKVRRISVWLRTIRGRIEMFEGKRRFRGINSQQGAVEGI